MNLNASIEGDTLDETLSAAHALVEEARIRFAEDGVEICAVDAANVAMVRAELDQEAFESYATTGGTLGMNLDQLTDIVGMADSGELVSLRTVPESAGRLEIEAGGSLEFTTGTIDPGTIRDEPDIPELDLPGTYVFDSGELSRALQASDMVSDFIRVAGRSEDHLRFTAKGDTDTVTVDLRAHKLLSGLKTGGDGPVSSALALSYLTDINTAIPRDTEVSMLVGDQYPVKLRWSSAEGDLSVTTMIAPRIEGA